MKENMLLSEVNRIREIMGLELISEDSAPSSNFLKKFLGTIVEPLLRTRQGNETLKKVLRATNSKISTTTINDIIVAIRANNLDNPLLENIDITRLYKQILKDLPTNDAIEQVRASVRNIFKTEFPKFDELASKVESSLDVLTPFNAKKNAKAYNELLDEFKKLKNQIESDNGISQEFKTLIIDSYGLNSLPKSAKEAVHIDENIIGLQKLFSNLYARISDITNERIANAPKKYKIGDIELDETQYKQLGEYSTGLKSINELPKSLQIKIITIIKSDDKFAEEYLKNYLKTIGKTQDEFIKDIFSQAKAKNTTWREILDREMNDFDYSILDDRLKISFTNMEGIYKLAFEESDAVYGKWRTKIRNVLQGFVPPALNSIDYLIYYFKTAGIEIQQGEKQMLKEFESILNDEMSKMAQESIAGVPIAGRLSKIRNIYSQLNQSTWGTQKAEAWFKTNLAKDGIFAGDKNYDIFVNSPEYEQLLKALKEGMEESTLACLSAIITPYLRLIGGSSWINLFENLFKKEFKMAGGSALGIFGNIVGGMVNTVIYAKPHTAAQMRVVDTLAGRYGKVFDKFVQIYLFTYLAVPYIRGYFERMTINEKLVSYRNNFTQIKTQFCSPGHVIDEQFCNEIDHNLQTLENTPSWDDISAELRSQTKLTSPWTLIPDFLEFYNEYTYETTEGAGTEQAIRNFISSWQQRVDSELANVNKELQNNYGIDTSLPIEQQQTQLFNAIKRREEEAKRQLESNKIDKSKKGFQNWASKNGYTVISDFNEDGIGSAYKNDDATETQIDFQWKNNTFQPY